MQNTLVSVYESTLKLMAPTTQTETYSAIVHEALDLVQAEHGTLFLLKEGELSRVFTTVSEKVSAPLPRRDGMSMRVLQTGQPYVLSKDKHPDHPALKSMGVRSVILLPLTYNSINLGVLSLRSERAKQFIGRRLQILKLFSSLCSLKLRNDTLYLELSEALKTQESFLSIAAHELKTPMTSMVLYAQLIKDAADKELPLQKALAASFYKSVQRLNSLEKNLLDTNQIKHGSLTYHKTNLDLKIFIKEVCQEFQLSTSSHTITFIDQATTARVLVDADRLYQVLINLLNNAAKYSAKASHISVFLKEDKNSLTIQIQDQGQGIPAEHLDNIFKMYYRADNKKQGLGLGLFVSKKIIEDHAGHMSISSQIGKGTTISLTLPRHA